MRKLITMHETYTLIVGGYMTSKKEMGVNVDAALQTEKAFFYCLIRSAAHELRTPLATITMASHATEKILADIFNGYKIAVEHKLVEPSVHPAKFQLIEGSFVGIKKAVEDAQNFLTILTRYVENYTMDPADTKMLSITACVDKLLSRYPFNNDQERTLVHVDLKHEFMFKAPEVFIEDLLLGLLKNALFYVRQANKGDVHIWTETTQDSNVLHFKDTGLGIETKNLPHAFDRLFSRRPDGTKAGLGFCKEVLRAFGASITCDSKEGEYTHFMIQFPIIK